MPGLFGVDFILMQPVRCEVEQKFPVADLEATGAALEALGAKVSEPREERDLYFAHPREISPPATRRCGCGGRATAASSPTKARRSTPRRRPGGNRVAAGRRRRDGHVGRFVGGPRISPRRRGVQVASQGVRRLGRPDGRGLARRDRRPGDVRRVGVDRRAGGVGARQGPLGLAAAKLNLVRSEPRLPRTAPGGADEFLARRSRPRHRRVERTGPGDRRRVRGRRLQGRRRRAWRPTRSKRPPRRCESAGVDALAVHVDIAGQKTSIGCSAKHWPASAGSTCL